MSVIRRFFLRLAAFATPRRADAELSRELETHLRLLEDEFVNRGLSADEARFAARRAFGGQVEQVKARQRDARSFRWLDESWLDLKLGVRMAIKFPGLTLIAVLALSVAIGGGAAYLEFLRDAMHPRLAAPQGDRIVGIQVWDVAAGAPQTRTLHDFASWRWRVASIEQLGAYLPLERTLVSDDGLADTVRGVSVTASAFALFPAVPILGRPLTDDDERPGAPAVVVIGETLWRARFASDPGVVGRTIALGRDTHTVVGVMPASFGFPINHALWTPARFNAVGVARGSGPDLRLFGRLAPGATAAAAQAELTAMVAAPGADAPGGPRLQVRVLPYVESLWASQIDGALQARILYAVNVFFIALLAVCGANVATLVFGRTITREGELTVRTALGASRARIVAQLFAEALVLASLAAFVGLAAASYGVRWGRQSLLDGAAAGAAAPFWWDDRLSPPTLIYAGMLTLLAAAIVGIVPALKATGHEMQTRLRHAAAGAGMRFGGLWTGVIVAQTALTVVFLLSVVSMGWNFLADEYRGGDVAFARDRFLSARLSLDADTDADADAAPGLAAPAAGARLAAAFREIERRVSTEPGVVGVTCASAFPGMKHGEFFVEFQDLPPILPADGPLWVQTASVGANFFDAFGASIVSGRGFTSDDVAFDRPVAIVDQTFVQQVLGGRNPVGHQVRQPQNSENPAAGPWYEIVGVVSDLAVAPRKTSEDAVLYRPAALARASAMYLAVQTRGDARALAPRLRAATAEVDPSLRLHEVLSLDQVNASDRMAAGFFLRALTIVSVVALVLSTAGVYSLMAFTVARRTREIGIRAAVGADRWQILAGIFSRAFTQVGIGVTLGSIPGGLLIAAGAPEVSRGSGPAMAAVALAAVCTFMLSVTCLACAVPARRALRIQPTDALRAD